MNKFLFASMALLCICLTSCNKEELEFTDTYEQEVTLRTPEVINVTYTDTSGNYQSVDCTEISAEHLSSSTIKMTFLYSDGSTQTVQGDDVTFSPFSGDLQVTKDSASVIIATDFVLDACRAECCYTYNNGNNIGTGLNFVIEEEPNGY